MTIFTSALSQSHETTLNAMTLLRLLCFCDSEDISIEMFRQECDILHSKNHSESFRARSVEGFRYSFTRVRSALHRRIRRDTVNVRENNKLDAAKDLFQSSVRLFKTIQKIQRLSLTTQTCEETDRIIRIHDLVHFLLRSKLMTDAEQKQWLKIIICIMCKVFEKIDDRISSQSRCDRFISHIESLREFAEQCELESTELLNASTWAAMYLNACELYKRAAVLSQRTVEQKTSILKRQNSSTLTSTNNLTLILKSQGKHEETKGDFTVI